MKHIYMHTIDVTKYKHKYLIEIVRIIAFRKETQKVKKQTL
jgi:hypothetical protein